MFSVLANLWAGSHTQRMQGNLICRREGDVCRSWCLRGQRGNWTAGEDRCTSHLFPMYPCYLYDINLFFVKLVILTNLMILQELMGSVSGEGNRRRLLELKANRLRQTGGQLQLFVNEYFPEKISRFCLRRGWLRKKQWREVWWWGWRGEAAGGGWRWHES